MGNAIRFIYDSASIGGQASICIPCASLCLLWPEPYQDSLLLRCNVCWLLAGCGSSVMCGRCCTRKCGAIYVIGAKERKQVTLAKTQYQGRFYLRPLWSSLLSSTTRAPMTSRQYKQKGMTGSCSTSKRTYIRLECIEMK